MGKNLPNPPEFSGIDHWINTPPLAMESLRGKVIGIEFWTHSCSNCQRAMPEMQKLYAKYQDKGFVLIGVHSPEFESDKDLEAIEEYASSQKLGFPIAVDNDMIMWNLYSNRYWPTLYLIDKNGQVRERHIGEGGYHRIENDIIHLLDEHDN